MGKSSEKMIDGGTFRQAMEPMTCLGRSQGVDSQPSTEIYPLVMTNIAIENHHV